MGRPRAAFDYHDARAAAAVGLERPPATMAAEVEEAPRHCRAMMRLFMRKLRGHVEQSCSSARVRVPACRAAQHEARMLSRI